MREIKFRAWDTDNKKMVLWGELLSKNLQNILSMPKYCGYELMQYTGIKDKNGKEIYEGDIIQDSFYDRKAEVVFLEGAFWLDYIKDFKEYETIHKRYQLIANYDNKEVLEVLGNIYDNPELLKEDK